MIIRDLILIAVGDIKIRSGIGYTAAVVVVSFPKR